jgi:sortase A
MAAEAGPGVLPAFTEPTFTKPGLHSYNVYRRMNARARRRRGFSGWARLCFLAAGLCGIAYYAYTLANHYLYQVYENWAFDQGIAGRRATLTDWVMQTTPLGQWVGYRLPAPVKSLPAANPPGVAQGPAASPALPEGALLGRVEVTRLKLSAIVKQGVSETTLSSAVGHVPSTQGPGAFGNFAIAAHRDTLFRALKDIRIGDEIQFQSAGGVFDYQVISTQIVKPSDVSVLRPQGNQRLLTMITCYPFYYVGSAPKRFIVTARLVPQSTAPPRTALLQGP